METFVSWFLVSALTLLVRIVFDSDTVLAVATQEHDQRIVVGIVCCESLTSSMMQRINATWWSELQHPLQTKSGSRVKVDLAFLSKPTSTTLSSAKQVSQLLTQESISIIVGPDDLILRMVSADQRTPLIAISSGFRQEVLGEEDGVKKGSEMDASLPPSVAGLTLQLMPAKGVFYRAVIDYARRFEWENVAVIYDSVEGLDLTGLLMEEQNLTTRSWRINSRATETGLRDQLMKVRSLEMRQIAVVCQPQVLQKLLNAALRLSMLSMRYSWIFVHPLPTYIDYEPFLYTGVNFVMFSLFTEDALKMIRADDQQITTEADDQRMTRIQEQLVHVLINDSLSLVTTTLKTMSSTAESDGDCSAGNSDQEGCRQRKSIDIIELIDSMRQGSFDGLSGKIQFDGRGRRTPAVFRVLGLNSSCMDGSCVNSLRLEEIGMWNESESNFSDRLRIHIRNNTNNNHHYNLSTRPLQRNLNRVVTLIDAPFVMYKKNHKDLTGNARYEGFLIDLFDRIAKDLDFRYELYESPDGNYGSKDENGNWNGMIRELIDGHAKMCLGAISITSDREVAVDFSKPFKQKMFNFLMKKPEALPSIFQFLSPLSTGVWLAIVSGLVLVSLLLFLLDRASPNFPDHRAGDTSDACFGPIESIWFMYGALVGGGTEGWNPRTASGRLLTSAWWFFGMIIISSYTANLAAFLTVTRIETPIKSISDLAPQTKIKYGTVRNTYAMSMFRNSQLEILQKMWQMMGQVYPDWMVNNTEQGIEKAKQGNYAFIWDAPINKYIATRDCSVISTGEPFDEKGYGIGVPMGAAYRDDLTMAILNLGEKGQIVEMEGRWWGSGMCSDFAETSTGNNEELSMSNVAGVFLLLSFGAILASIVCLIEYISTRFAIPKNIWRHRNNSSHTVEEQKMSSLTEPEVAI